MIFFKQFLKWGFYATRNLVEMVKDHSIEKQNGLGVKDVHFYLVTCFCFYDYWYDIARNIRIKCTWFGEISSNLRDRPNSISWYNGNNL